ncbi:MAG: HAD family hydrolase [Desulfurococcaceae archaeon TW002]
MSKDVRAVSFDLWFTLIYEEEIDERIYTLMRVKALYESLSKFKEVSLEDVMDVYKSLKFAREYLSAKSLVNLMTLALGIKLSREELERLSHNYVISTRDFIPKVNREVYEVIPKIRELGLKIAIVSNTSFSEEGVRAMLENLRLANYFDVVVSSSSLGYNKPNPRIYKYLMRKLGLKPQEILHVGDSCINDVLSPVSVGLRAALYVGLRKDKDVALCSRLDIPILRSLSELLEKNLITRNTT